MKKLDKRKALASRVLGVGKNKIKFDETRLEDIKEAITKQDIKDLYAEGIIEVKPARGRTKIVKRKTRKGPGKVKKKVNDRKQRYVKLVRKLRNYIKELKKQEKLTTEEYKELRKKIKANTFKSKANLKEHIEAKEK